MITLCKNRDTELAIAVRSPLFAWMGGVGGLALGYLAYLFLSGHSGDDRVTGVGGLFLTCLLAFLVYYEKADFLFDVPSRSLTWSRQKGFLRRGGTMPFDAIESVVLQSGPTAEKEYPSYRVVLIARGEELPLSIAYAHDGKNEEAAKQIGTLLGLPSGSDTEQRS